MNRGSTAGRSNVDDMNALTGNSTLRTQLIWLLYFAASGCAASPSPVAMAAADHHSGTSVDETAAIERVEADLEAVQSALAEQPPSQSTTTPASTQTHKGGHGNRHGMPKNTDGMTAAGEPPAQSPPLADDAAQHSKESNPTVSNPTLAQGSNPSGHGMKGKSSMDMSASPPADTSNSGSAGASNGTTNKKMGMGNGMSGNPPAMDKPSDSTPQSSNPSGAMSSDKGMGKGKSGMSKRGMGGGMNMGRGMQKPMSGGMCCGRMGSMMGKPKMMGQSDTSDSSTAAPAADPSSGTGHVLHLGERDFYLDLQTELALTTEQVQTLTEHRSHWLNERATHQAAIDTAETTLWQLTQALAPNPDQVAGAVREVERLRSAQRLAFIESVSTAVSTLTPAQIAKARTLPYSGAP